MIKEIVELSYTTYDSNDREIELPIRFEIPAHYIIREVGKDRKKLLDLVYKCCLNPEFFDEYPAAISSISKKLIQAYKQYYERLARETLDTIKTLGSDVVYLQDCLLDLIRGKDTKNSINGALYLATYLIKVNSLIDGLTKKEAT